VLVELLGRGGMAEVYRATDRVLDRSVAVKVFRAFPDLVARHRFDDEARALARLSHAGLISIFDVGMVDDRAYLAMQLVEGESLQSRLLSGPLSVADTVRLGGQLAEALAHAHGRGVVHRDVKPSNILLDGDNLPYLTDFGIALLTGATRMTSADEIIGTPAYLAPEQVLGADVGPAADVYALALVLLECLTGEIEYPGGSKLEVAVARLNRSPRMPAGLPRGLADLLAAMTASDPDVRPTAQQCARQLPAMLNPAVTAPRPAETTVVPIDARVALPGSAQAPASVRAAIGTATTVPVTSGSTTRRWWPLTAAAIGIATVAAGLVLVLVATDPQLTTGRPPTGAAGGTPSSQGAAGATGNQPSASGTGGAAASGAPAVTLLVSGHPDRTTVAPVPVRDVPATRGPQGPAQGNGNGKADSGNGNGKKHQSEPVGPPRPTHP